VSNAALLVRGFPSKLGFLADFLYFSLISLAGNSIEIDTDTWDEERSSELAMGQGVAPGLRAETRFA
jgi:hypothetical protein